MPEQPTSEKACWKCQCDVMNDDKFCRHCGSTDPGQYIGWDWREQPDLLALNPLLAPYGCRIEMPETGRDEYAARVVPVNSAVGYDAGSGKSILL